MKKLQLLWTSFRQSILIKPTAMIALVIMIAMTIASISIPLRLTIAEVENIRYNIGGRLMCTWDSDDIIEAYSPSGMKGNAKKLQELEIDLFDSEYWNIRQYVDTVNVKLYKRVEDKKELLVEDMEGYSLIYQSSFFTAEEIDKGARIAYVGDYLAKEYNLGVGDTIAFGGSEYVIKGVNTDSAGICIPYTANVRDYKFSYIDDPRYIADTDEVYYYATKHAQIYMEGIVRPYTEQDLAVLSSVGLKLDYGEIVGSLMFIIMGICVLVVSIMVLLVILGYMNESFARKHCIYKMTGMTDGMTLCSIMLETSVLSLLGIALGKFVEYILSVSMSDITIYPPIKHLEWVYHLSTILLIFIIVMVTTLCKQIRVARSSAVDPRYMR